MPQEIAFEGSSDKFNAAMDEWQQRMSKAHNRADLIIAKQPHGPTGTISCCSKPNLPASATLTHHDVDLCGR